MSAIASALQRLFVNRHDDYAVQQPNGQYHRAEEPLSL